MQRVYIFPGNAKATLSEVGGKGLSLIHGSAAGLPVPPGFVLTVEFFEPWLTQLKKSVAWKHFLTATDENLPAATEKLKTTAARFKFTEEQEQLLADALAQSRVGEIFAVRSSSPNEDLEGASFAGGYETVLGVTPKKIHAAIKHCFQSALDHRVVVYMRQNGFNAADVKIAIVVQRQVASDISGVGFSLNPVSNYYDEAVFNANWGLGETVVSGVITPDTFCVDKVSGVVTEAALGSKDFSLWLKPGGGTIKKDHFRSEERTLDEGKLLELTDLIKKVEAFYEKPMDIEWAYEKDALYLLQARPITTYVPLSPEMLSKPGEKRRLYFDITLTAQAMMRPISISGTSLFRHLVKVLGRIAYLREIGNNPDETIPWISDGRIFANLSNGFTVAGRRNMLSVLSVMDGLGAKAVETLNPEIYRSTTPRYKLLPIGLAFRLPRILFFLWYAKRNPAKTHAWVMGQLSIFEEEAQQIARNDIPLGTMFEELVRAMFFRVFRRTVPLTFYARKILARMSVAAQNDPLVKKLELALPHNVTIEMGLSLAHIASLLPQGLSATEIKKGIAERSLPKECIEAWQQFIVENGFRGPQEIDVASPRYEDDPEILINLLLSTQKGGENPEESYTAYARERRAAFESLYQKIRARDKKEAEKFENDYAFFETFGGYRETHKKYLVYVVGIMRRKILAIGERFVADGRLDTVESIFDLTVEEIDEACSDRSLDLRQLAHENTVFIKRLARVPNPPTVIDSRGFIPRPPRPHLKPGEMAGEGVSTGKIQGRIKVLHTPDEKPLHKGEILVARATDPGWTPLFVNAGGIILEIGGSLQHGALVAREYGIPCVTGIEKATQLTDGSLVEVDGDLGVVRLLEEKSTAL